MRPTNQATIPSTNEPRSKIKHTNKIMSSDKKSKNWKTQKDRQRSKRCCDLLLVRAHPMAARANFDQFSLPLQSCSPVGHPRLEVVVAAPFLTPRFAFAPGILRKRRPFNIGVPDAVPLSGGGGAGTGELL